MTFVLNSLLHYSGTMVVESNEISFHTKREGEIVDLTDRAQSIITNGNLIDGVALLFVAGATGADHD